MFFTLNVSSQSRVLYIKPESKNSVPFSRDQLLGEKRKTDWRAREDLTEINQCGRECESAGCSPMLEIQVQRDGRSPQGGEGAGGEGKRSGGSGNAVKSL